jgi:hypothetical protein
METRSSPSSAPGYVGHRFFRADAGPPLALTDPLSVTDRRRGINMGGYRAANIHVVPLSPGANPDVEVLFWSEAAGEFIPGNTPIAKAGIGVGKPYEFRVDCNGRIMFVKITGGLADTEEVEVYVAGFGT